MGLFDKIKSDNSEQKEKDKSAESEFSSIVIESEDIPREVKRVASANNLPLSQLDFKILNFKTFYETDKKEGWIEVREEELKQFKQKDFLLNPDLKIKQSYKVDIFRLNDSEHTPTIPTMVLSGNRALTKIIITIKKDIEVRYFSKLESRIIEEINKKKIKAGILIGIGDELMHEEVKTLVSSIRINSIMSEDGMFVVCQGVDLLPCVNDSFIYHYKKKFSKEDDHGRIDHSRRGYILAVSKGECVMEYIKPQLGVAGRNCKGEYLGVKEPQTNYEISISHTENIVKKEDDERVKYVANKNGYITEDSPNSFDIKDSMEIDEISFKTTGSIQTDMSAEVKIDITEDDALKDAIGYGMSVETYELNIKGNVASGAKIKAEILSIGGQTHGTSMIEAKNAKITIHRGALTAQEVYIESLEGGKVVGDIIHVKQASGGEIIGKNIVIDELGSNVSIVASDTIEIKELRGMNNKFLIDPSMTKEFSQSTKRTTKKIAELSQKLKPMPKLLDEKKRAVDSTKSTVKMVKKKIIELKKDGKNPPSTLFVKVKEFQKSVDKYNKLLNSYKNGKLKLKELREDLNQIQTKVFSAKIINRSVWKEYNEIKFKLLSPATEKVYNTKKGEIIREMSLIQRDDGSYEIKKSMEHST